MSSIGIGGSSPIVRPDTGINTDGPSSASGTEAAGLSSQVFGGNSSIQGEAAAGTIRFGARGNNIRAIQVGLARLGFLSGSLDGIMGRGTERAVVTFQRSQGLGADGIVGPKTLAALDAAISAAPDAGTDSASGPGGISGSMLADELKGPNQQSMVDAAKSLVENHAQNYGVDDPWVNVDSRHALPANVRLGGLKGKWKCNLFAGNAMAAAGFEPPYYNNRGRGEYPNANQLFKWSDKYAGQFGNRGNERFELRGELDPQALPSGPERDQAIKDLLATAEPGDMIIVDHMGSDVADGGHCRVVMSNNIEADGTIDCAQASFDSALTRGETVSSFTGEERIWILRPNKKRPEGAAPVG